MVYYTLVNQVLDLFQERQIQLTDVNPIFFTEQSEISNADSLVINRVEVEINNPENLTLHVRYSNTEGKSNANQVELKKFKKEFLFKDNKHILETENLKQFKFSSVDTTIKEIEVTSEKFHTFKITLAYRVKAKPQNG